MVCSFSFNIDFTAIFNLIYLLIRCFKISKFNYLEEYQSLNFLLNCIMRSDISFACIGIVVSFIYRYLFPCYLIKETIFFNTIISNIWYLKCSEKCSSKFFHKLKLLRIYILKDSRILLQKWPCYVRDYKSTSHGITAPDVLFGKKKTEIRKT